MNFQNPEPEITSLKLNGKEISILRLDLLPTAYNGNKWFKLKYNLEEAVRTGEKRILTFGGAYSNHIYALAAATKEAELTSIGIIRGERIEPLNSTLRFAEECGMELHFINRSEYRRKKDQDFIENLKYKFGDFYLIPEGGSNELGIKGASEILSAVSGYDIICTPVGTGGTLAGLIYGKESLAEVLGFMVVRDKTIQRFVESNSTDESWKLIGDFDFGGYARYNQSLIDFINEFKSDFSIQLDPIYTGKMMFGINQLITDQYFDSKAKILVVHTGGQQGIKGFNERFDHILN